MLKSFNNFSPVVDVEDSQEGEFPGKKAQN